MPSFEEPGYSKDIKPQAKSQCVDGVIGAIVADMGLDPSVAKALFIFGRLMGLSAHFFEEVTTQPVMRTISCGRSSSARRSTAAGPKGPIPVEIARILRSFSYTRRCCGFLIMMLTSARGRDSLDVVRERIDRVF